MSALSRTFVFVALASIALPIRAAQTPAPKAVAVVPETVRSSGPKPPKWLLPAFLKLADKDPNRLLRLGDKLFSDARLRISSVDVGAAYEWQHRLAMVQALSTFFEEGVRPMSAKQKKFAHRLLSRALHKDPALLVRDGAVDAVGRILRADPGQASSWKTELEEAFLDPQNIVGGEGLFIRETILKTMREVSLPLSARIRKAAARDKSAGVKSALADFDTRIGKRLR